jgi:hypothetical protein
MLQRAFADVHELAITPVSTDREVGEVVFSRVKQMALAADWEVWWSESLAHGAEKEAAFVDVILRLVHPVALAVFVTTRQRLCWNTILRSKAMGSHDKLNEGEWKMITGCQAHSGWCIGNIGGIGAFEEWVEYPSGL